LFESRENALGSGVDTIGGEVAPPDDAFVVQYEECSCGFTNFLFVCSELSRNVSLWLEVRENREVEFAIFREREMGPYIVNRNGEKFPR